MKKIKIGLVGYGSVAEKMHAPLIHTSPHMELYGVVERNNERSKERYEHVKIFKSIEELLGDIQVDLVVIATPNEFHFEQARQALEAGNMCWWISRLQLIPLMPSSWIAWLKKRGSSFQCFKTAGGMEIFLPSEN